MLFLILLRGRCGIFLLIFVTPAFELAFLKGEMDACSYAGTHIGSHACVCTFRFKISISSPFHAFQGFQFNNNNKTLHPLHKKKKELILAYSPLYIMSLVLLFYMSFMSHVTLRIASLACQSVLHLGERTILVKARCSKLDFFFSSVLW